MEATGTGTFAQFPGGNFTAVQGEDGTWTIKDVPILAQMAAKERRNRHEVDSAWMRRCIERHRQLEREEKHLAPVHENHHDPGAQTKRIGFMRPTRVGTVMAKGKPVDALFADFVGVSDEDYQALKQLRLPYRSVEVHPSWDPQIESLALMQDESPHHKLPMLTIGEEKRSRNLVALRKGHDHLYIVQDFGDGNMPATKKKTKAKKPSEVDKLAEDKDEDEDDSEDLEAGTEISTAIKELQDSIPGLVQSAIESKIAEIKAAMGGGDEEGDPADEDDDGPMEQFRESNDMDRLKALEKTNADLAGRLAALEKKDRDRADADEVDSLVSSECDKLRADGWSVDDEDREAMRAQAKNAVDKKAAVETFAAAFRRNTPQDPPEDVEMLSALGLRTGTETDNEFPEEVAAYRDRGPDALARAVSLWRDHESLKSSLRGFDMPLKDHIEINWDAA